MSNGVDFRRIALELRDQLVASESLSAELLGALDGLFGHITARDLISGGELKRRIDLARTAIAKARGES